MGSNVDIEELIITILSSCPEGVDGRTAIQKLGYLSSVKLNMDAGYEADLYGPFSPIVASNLQTLVEFDFVVEKARQTVRNRTMYNYYLTADGHQFAEVINKKFPTEHRIISKVVNACSRIVNCNYRSLSWASKVHFILKKTEKPMNYTEAMNAGKLFGWKLNQSEVEAGVKLLQALHLILVDTEK
ncbi:MAG: hypothetical protein ABSC20_05230 [Candidatus Bathyarchaeia archaeon]